MKIVIPDPGFFQFSVVAGDISFPVMGYTVKNKSSVCVKTEGEINGCLLILTMEAFSKKFEVEIINVCLMDSAPNETEMIFIHKSLSKQRDPGIF